jgi:hypothetical protein
MAAMAALLPGLLELRVAGLPHPAAGPRPARAGLLEPLAQELGLGRARRARLGVLLAEAKGDLRRAHQVAALEPAEADITAAEAAEVIRLLIISVPVVVGLVT